MKLSEISPEEVKKALCIDYDYDDDFLLQIMAAAKDYMKNYTGLSADGLDEYPMTVHAFYCICGDMYDNRSAQITGSAKENPTVKTILLSIARNYL